MCLYKALPQRTPKGSLTPLLTTFPPESVLQRSWVVEKTQKLAQGRSRDGGQEGKINGKTIRRGNTMKKWVRKHWSEF